MTITINEDKYESTAMSFYRGEIPGLHRDNRRAKGDMCLEKGNNGLHLFW